MNALTTDIYSIIPQRPPMVMIDALVQCDRADTVTRYTVKDECVLNDGDCLAAEGIAENIAQTCAARIGYLNLQAGETVRLGYIGAIKDFVVTCRPHIGQTIETTVTVKEEIFGITLVDAAVTTPDGSPMATATMKIALSEIAAAR